MAVGKNVERQPLVIAVLTDVFHHLGTGAAAVIDQHIITTLRWNAVNKGLDARTTGHLAGRVADDDPGPRLADGLDVAGQDALDETLGHRHAGSDHHAQLDDGVEDDVEAREMFAVEDEHRVIEHVHIAHRVLVRALALVMDHRRGQEPVLVARLDDAVTQVDVLAVHEEILVKAAQLLQHAGAAQHVGARQDVDALRLLVAQVAQVIFGKQGRPWKQLRQAEDLAERYPWRGEGALALGQEHAIAVHHPGADGSALGMGFHPRNALVQALGRDDGIGVEDERVFSPGLHDGLVVGPCEPHIFLILDIAHLGMPLPREGDAVVARQVIDDDDLAGHALHSLFHRAQGLLQQVLHALVDNDDSQIHGSLSGLFVLISVAQCCAQGGAVVGKFGNMEMYIIKILICQDLSTSLKSK